MLYVAVALVAPEAEVGKTEHNRMILVLGSMRIHHVWFNVARAGDGATVGPQANPVFTTVLALEARIQNALSNKILAWSYVLGCAVGTVPFGGHGKKSFHIIIKLVKFLSNDYLLSQ